MPAPALYSFGDIVYLVNNDRPYIIKNCVYVGGTRLYDYDIYPANKRTFKQLKRGWGRWEYEDTLIPKNGMKEVKQQRILNKIKYLDKLFSEKKHVRI